MPTPHRDQDGGHGAKARLCPPYDESALKRASLALSAFPLTADLPQSCRYVRFVPILLQKSFWGSGRKFLEPLMRFARGDVRDHIASSEIDHGPP